MSILHAYRIRQTTPQGIEYELGIPCPDGARVALAGPPKFDGFEGEHMCLDYIGPAAHHEKPTHPRAQEWADAKRLRDAFRKHAYSSVSVGADALKAFERDLALNLKHVFGEALPRANDNEWSSEVVPILRGLVQLGCGSYGFAYAEVFRRIYDHLVFAAPSDGPEVSELDAQLRPALVGGSPFVPVNASALALEAEHEARAELLARREAPKRGRPIGSGMNTKTCRELSMVVLRVLRTAKPHPLFPLVENAPEAGGFKFVVLDADGFAGCFAPSGPISFGVDVMGHDEIPPVDGGRLRAAMRIPSKEQRVALFHDVRPALRSVALAPIGETHDLKTHEGMWRLQLADEAITWQIREAAFRHDRGATRLWFEALHRGVGLASDVALTIMLECARATHEAKYLPEATRRQATGNVLEYDDRANKKVPWTVPAISEDFESEASLMAAVRNTGFSDEAPWLDALELYRTPTQAEAAEVAKRMARDPWTDVLATLIGEPPRAHVKSDEIAEHLRAAGALQGDPTPHTHVRINAAMVRLGYEKKQISISGNRFNAFVLVPLPAPVTIATDAAERAFFGEAKAQTQTPEATP